MRERIWEFLFKIERNKLFASVKKSFMLTVPILLIGTAAVLINSILLPLIADYILVGFNDLISSFCVGIYGATVGCVSLYLAIAVGYYYAQAKGVENALLRLMVTLTGVICFVILIGGISSEKFASYMGVIGVLPAIVVELLSVHCFLMFTKLISRNRKEVNVGIDDNIKVSVVTVLPTLLTILVFMVIQYVFTTVLSVGDLYDNLTNFFYLLFNSDSSSLFNGALFSLLVSLLWVLGIHGGNVMDPISEAILVPMNSDATEIMSKSFIDVFTTMGGSGATLCLVVAIFLVSRSKTTGNIARSAAPMIIFNINELMVFGLPIIFNPIMAIPFVTVPLISLFIAYFATAVGFIPIITETVNWATPIFLSGYRATGSINGVIVQLVILICGTCIYIPFVKLLDKFHAEKEMRILNELIDIFCENEAAGKNTPMLTRPDALGETARIIAHKLRKDVESDSVDLYYQPQMGSDDYIVGGEALLRWKYGGQFIYPPFVIAIARQEGILNQLTTQSAQRVCDTINDIKKGTGESLRIALNMSASQLDDVELIDDLIKITKKNKTLDQLHLELTEETSLSGFRNINGNINKLCNEGIVLAIDDFGMGQTSINYLKEHTFGYVKIDGSLVKQILTNSRCDQIIESIIELGHNLDYEVIAEYVGSIEIKEKLMEMGCNFFQGYYYSPAIPKEDFIKYCSDIFDREK